MPDRPCCDHLATWLEPGTLKALGDPSRAAILLHLAGAEDAQTVTELAAALPVDTSVVSRHLKVLREVGVVTAERDGREVFHRLDCGDLVHMLRNLADALESCCPPANRTGDAMNRDQLPHDPDQHRRTVADGYADLATSGESCGCSAPGDVSSAVGYSAQDLQIIPQAANLGLGCGAPVSFAELRPGETVVDLGAGAGMDAFLAARQVGETGHVIGIDMTDVMLDKARENAREGGFENVEFRKGVIEEMPVDDGWADVILSNCVINLSPEKSRVFREAVRVLKPGGRMVVSDIVLDAPLPEAMARNATATIGCVGGAVLREEYLAIAREAGFTSVEVLKEMPYAEKVGTASRVTEAVVNDTGMSHDEVAAHLENVRSATVRLVK